MIVASLSWFFLGKRNLVGSKSLPEKTRLSILSRGPKIGVHFTVLWIWRNSIISRRGSGSRKIANRRIFIDRHALADDESIRNYYDIGVERGLGIALRVFCVADGNPLCYIYLPEDETAAEYPMMSSLKCSLPTPCPTATFVNYQFLAVLLRLVIRTPRSAWITNEVPLRPARS